ncbi:MAG: hypothetical protein HC836_39500 [Richelia sp. RM2_1_2]|nr:hypothetical protein [Richelia sp. SM2_1_7]NJM22236.1 hypothetical protein [Richelia sp. SM1_7_0]NJN12608.1 hypothetical protein [Richelia sp. RM1_1_1]NJO30937.1 hypothetical protein [Richelia sp. SL_2_1]NJO64052.1 hypothetical protein [Richelia sp. RM2_1_2]
MADNKNKAVDSSERVQREQYDRGIIPAETAARREREKENYKTTPDKEEDQSLDTTEGYTVDQEGLLNNYAVEPEMYYEEPGDARQQAEEEAAQRAEELEEVNQDQKGDLTMDADKRGKGPGII